MGDTAGRYVHRSQADLQHLGERVRDKVIETTARLAGAHGVTGNNTIDTWGSNRVEDPASAGQDRIRRVKLHAYISDQYRWIPTMFTRLSIPDPTMAERTVRDLLWTANSLDPRLLDPGDTGKPATNLDGRAPLSGPIEQISALVNRRLAHWNGLAATKCVDYLNKYDDAAENQRDVALALATTLALQLTARKQLITDVWTIGQTTSDYLDSMLGVFPNVGKVEATLTIVGAVAAVALAFPSGGASLATEATQSLASVLGALGGNPPDGKDKFPIGGDVPETVLLSTRNALTKVQKDYEHAQQEIVIRLKGLTNAVNRLSHQILPPPPVETLAVADDKVNTLYSADGFWAQR